ncbi:MAG: acyl-CoA dehydrogenase family protein [Chloroflexi bacterium]|nr:acyl-CoA dehydrogenase family protein [Chloroflexota bacterium]
MKTIAKTGIPGILIAKECGGAVSMLTAVIMMIELAMACANHDQRDSTPHHCRLALRQAH